MTTYSYSSKNTTYTQSSLSNQGTHHQGVQQGRLFERLANAETRLFELTPQGGGQNTESNENTDNNANDGKWRRLIGLPAYYWLLLAQLLVLMPLIGYLPFWLIGFGVVSIVAQLPEIKARMGVGRRKRRLYQTLQLTGFFLGLVGLWLTYGFNFGVDVGVAFLLLCLIGKLWELYKRRDAYVVLNLSLFVLASAFLLDQGLGTTLKVLLGATAILLAFVAINDDGNLSGKGRLRSFGLLAGLALPLMLALFMFFPRLPPLWSLQLSGSQATTGVSDSMSPGDFANLSQSTELAFRVEFTGKRPSQPQLYWRGLVFSEFDGITWTRSEQQSIWTLGNIPGWANSALQTIPAASREKPVTYQVTLEPTQQRWLFGLDYPYTQEPGVAITSVFTLIRRDPVVKQLRYTAQQFEGMRIDTQLSEPLRKLNVAIPQATNPQAQQYAQKLFAQTGHDPVQYINALREWIRNDEFFYTLSPPPLGNNRIDDFLFGTKAGFCEHYASSFTFMMRAVGIPARVVAGYQGGEIGRDGSSWEVRQMDAHAWTEIWLDGQGWVRVDPTAFVAPMRVEQGMNELTQQRGAAMFGTGAGAQLSYQQFKMLQQISRLSDQVSYYWQRDIVGYDQNKQANSLLKWFNITSLMQQVLWMGGTIVTIMSMVIAILWYRRRQKWHEADLPMVQLAKRMAKADASLALHPYEGVLDWISRLQVQSGSEEQDKRLQDVKMAYRRLRYGKQSQLDPKSPEYKLGIKQLKALIKHVK